MATSASEPYRRAARLVAGPPRMHRPWWRKLLGLPAVPVRRNPFKGVRREN